MNHSPGIMLIWRFAVMEAAKSEHEFIEPEHFVQAMTRGESLTDDAILKFVAGDKAVREAMIAEFSVVHDVLASRQVNTVTLRRSLRARLGKGNHPHAKGETLHRSERSRRVFAAAKSMAKDCGTGFLQVGHLFLAILHDENSSKVTPWSSGGDDEAEMSPPAVIPGVAACPPVAGGIP
jgi:ATP-dependent Clp protease ATP-binding subunit ClpA